MVTVSRPEKTLGDIWTHQNMTTPVSWLSLAKYYIKANKIVATRALAPTILFTF